MATYTITAGQRGSYSMALAANTVITVQAPGDGDRNLIVGVISGAQPVYARGGQTVTVADPASVEIPSNFQMSVGSDITNTIALISGAAAVVSVWVG